MAEAKTSKPRTSQPAFAKAAHTDLPPKATQTAKPKLTVTAKMKTKPAKLTLATFRLGHGRKLASHNRSRYFCNYPVDHSGVTQHGLASYYGTGSGAWRTTASGAALDPHALTAASPTLPIGSQADVTNLRNGRQLRVLITDRGPYGPGMKLDLTPAAAEQLGMMQSGRDQVEIKPVPGTLD